MFPDLRWASPEYTFSSACVLTARGFANLLLATPGHFFLNQRHGRSPAILAQFSPHLNFPKVVSQSLGCQGENDFKMRQSQKHKVCWVLCWAGLVPLWDLASLGMLSHQQSAWQRRHCAGWYSGRTPWFRDWALSGHPLRQVILTLFKESAGCLTKR